ncbi:MAG: hypothetical protein CMN87_01260 [Stappia sp.]|uniref:hypothetical protein n=1 Tax=Stappia sp. TaxID=1870903 RepID=UPI000C44A573|nr:hypothetical protein [Stappia sp.]MAB00501.1 hypothetical protein [Stappia sp.]MBM18613.1 hypothetical protein [Stappia sp.]
MRMSARVFGLAVGGAVMLAGAGHAAGLDDRPQVDRDRYVLAPAGDIFLRLDRETGRVAECSKVNATWRCVAVPDAQLALEAEIERLGKQVTALRAENAELRRKAGLARPGESVPKTDALPRVDGDDEPTFTPEEEKELGRALDFTEKAMRRFFGMMKSLREEYDDLGN